MEYENISNQTDTFVYMNGTKKRKSFIYPNSYVKKILLSLSRGGKRMMVASLVFKNSYFGSIFLMLSYTGLMNTVKEEVNKFIF